MPLNEIQQYARARDSVNALLLEIISRAADPAGALMFARGWLKQLAATMTEEIQVMQASACVAAFRPFAELITNPDIRDYTAICDTTGIDPNPDS